MKKNNDITKTSTKWTIGYRIELSFLIVTLVCFIFALIYFLATVSPSSESFMLYISQRILIFPIVLLPIIIEKIFKIKFPYFFNILLYFFLILAVFLGTFLDFNNKIYFWDSILHFSSAVLFGFLCLVLLPLFFKDKPSKFSAIFIFVFAFTFSLTIEAVWEIYEYTIDGIFTTYNAQNYMENGVMLVGRQALYDTMKDIILGASGSFCAVIISAICYKINNNYINSFEIKKMTRK